MLDISRHPYIELSNRVMTEALRLQAEANSLRPILEAEASNQITPQQTRIKDQIMRGWTEENSGFQSISASRKNFHK